MNGGGILTLNNNIKIMIAVMVVLHAISIFVPQDFWHDASFTYKFSEKDIGFILDSNDVHPPLYYIITKAWQAYSANEYWLRFLSIIFFAVFLIGIKRYMAERGFGEFAQLCTITFIGLSSTILYYSTEYRNYMMAMAIVVWQSYYFFKFVVGKTEFQSYKYVVLSALMFYTHYYTAFVMVVQALYIIAQKNKDVLKNYVRNCAYIMILWIPVLIHFLRTLPKMHSMWFYEVDLWSILSGISYQFNLPDTVSAIIIIAYVMLTCVIILYYLISEQKPYYELMLFFIPFAILWSLSYLVYPVYHHRFLLFFSFGLYVILGNVVERLSDMKPSMMSIHFIMMAMLVFSLLSYDDVLPTELRESQMELKTKIGQCSYIIHLSSFSMTPYNYYFRDECVINKLLTGLDETERFTAGGAVIEQDDVVTKDFFDRCTTTDCYMVIDGLEYPNYKQYDGGMIYDKGGLKVFKIVV